MPGDGLIEDFILRAFLHDVLLKKYLYNEKYNKNISLYLFDHFFNNYKYKY